MTSISRPRRLKAPGDPDCASDPLCCAPIGDAALGQSDAENLSGVLKALADPARLRLLSLVRASPAGEVCVGDLVDALHLSQPTVSHHLRILTDAGLLDRDRRGNWVWYSPNDARLAEVRGLLH